MMLKSIIVGALTTVATLDLAHAYTTIDSLPNHTIYYPTDTSANPGPWPVILWGNGGCNGQGGQHAYFLQTLCDKGYVAIAPGDPNGSKSDKTNAGMMTESLNWVQSNSTDHGVLNDQLNVTNIAAAGHSCGGEEAQTIAVQNPDIIQLLALYSSAWGPTPLEVPTFLVTGGNGDSSLDIPVDLALSAAHSLYPDITTPKWIGDLETITLDGKQRGVGHDGTFWLPDDDGQYTGGEYAQHAILIFGYRLKKEGTLASLTRPGWANIQSSDF